MFLKIANKEAWKNVISIFCLKVNKNLTPYSSPICIPFIINEI